MRSRHVFIIVLMLLGSSLALAADDKPLTPVEARKQAGEKVTVEMVVEAAKDRLEKRGEIYLDSEVNFKDDKNFAIVITRDGAAWQGEMFRPLTENVLDHAIFIVSPERHVLS